MTATGPILLRYCPSPRKKITEPLHDQPIGRDLSEVGVVDDRPQCRLRARPRRGARWSVRRAGHLLAHRRPEGQADGRDDDCVVAAARRSSRSTHGADYRETLTGFKWIGNAAIEYEREQRRPVRHGLRGGARLQRSASWCATRTACRRRCMFAELAAWNRARGKTHARSPRRRLSQGRPVRDRAGVADPPRRRRPGADPRRDGALPRRAARRSSPATPIDERRRLRAARAACRRSDVLVFKLAGGRRVIMRPSGTEPKLKSYYEVRVEVGADEPMAAARRAASPSSPSCATPTRPCWPSLGSSKNFAICSFWRGGMYSKLRPRSMISQNSLRLDALELLADRAAGGRASSPAMSSAIFARARSAPTAR